VKAKKTLSDVLKAELTSEFHVFLFNSALVSPSAGICAVGVYCTCTSPLLTA
jgi:hypothetical protein